MLNNQVSKAVRLALMFGAASASVASMSAFAADEAEKVERIEVTGSSIKGTDLAGALPISVISSDDIKKTGVVSVPELISQIPSMQGFTTPADSVGGGGAGTATANLRSIGDGYTLVLLNGRRLAPSGSGSSVDLNSIPIAAVERVEVLTDGASALYGSDAIAGVINFILKKEVTETTVSVRTDQPRGGAESYSASITTGFGDYDADGFSLVASLSYDERSALKSTAREFAKTGFLEFEYDGQNYYDINGSSNAIPANAFVDYKTTVDGKEVSKLAQLNPYLEKNGQCADHNATLNSPLCSYDFTSTLEIYPEYDRKSFVLQGEFKVNDDIKAFASALYTDYTTTPRIAPNPTGFINIPLDSVLYANYVKPYLTEEQAANATRFRATWRALPGGNRSTEYNTETYNTILGLDGVLFDTIDFNTAVVYSKGTRTANVKNGYFYADKFVDAISSGRVNIFLTPEEFAQDQASIDALEAAQWRHNDDVTVTENLSFDIRASQPIFELPAGDAYIGYGVEYRNNTYSLTRSAENVADTQFGDGGGDFDYELERSSYGAFAELQIPILENLSMNAALRYDSIGGVEDNLTSAGKVNEDESDTTYKVSLRYEATEDLVFRASYGTGFKAATMTEIARPLSAWGVTSDNYNCPVPSSDPRAQYCPPDNMQYDVYLLGNKDLKPETSKQHSIGFVYSPSTELSLELDYWKVEIEDMVQTPDEAFMFQNRELFDKFFVVKPDRSDSTSQTLALVQGSINIGKSITAGYDWKVTYRNDFDLGTLKTTVQGTYIDEQEYTVGGVLPFEWATSLGRYGVDNAVVFRNIINIQNVFSHGDFAHTLRWKYKSGWTDAEKSVGVGSIAFPYYNKDGSLASTTIQRSVPSHVTVDYKLDYTGIESATISVGVNNIFDKEPPLSLGDPAGHLVGYEGRYYDQFLRTFYLNAEYTF